MYTYYFITFFSLKVSMYIILFSYETLVTFNKLQFVIKFLLLLISKNVYNLLNSNGVQSLDDFYRFTFHNVYFTIFLFSIVL